MFPDGVGANAMPAPTSMCTATGRFASTAASHSGQNCGLPYSSRDCSGTPICTTRGWSLYFVDLAQRAGDVVGIDPDGAAEPVAELVVVEPARHHHLVVRRGDRGAEVAVGHDAAGHRVQDRDVDAALVEQVAWPTNSGSEPGYCRSGPSVPGAYSPPGAPYQSIS